MTFLGRVRLAEKTAEFDNEKQSFVLNLCTVLLSFQKERVIQ